jgi:hypothetical protein
MQGGADSRGVSAWPWLPHQVIVEAQLMCSSLPLGVRAGHEGADAQLNTVYIFSLVKNHGSGIVHKDWRIAYL